MEKVKIKFAVNSGKQWQGNPIINITTEDGRVGCCIDERILQFAGKEIELDVKPGKMYNEIQQYYFNFPKPEGKGGFAKKDYTSEKRMKALELSINMLINLGKTYTSDEALTLADKWLNWLNKN